MAFVAKTNVFEGPLDLLLALIEKRKLLINEISLAKVADDFIAYVQSHQEFPLGETAHFILVASTLLLIKSKSLLPNLSLTEEESADVASLEERLRTYQRIKELSQGVAREYGMRVLCPRIAKFDEAVVFAPDRRITGSFMLECARSVLKALPVFAELPTAMVKKVVSLEEMIKRLGRRISDNLQLSFKEFSGMGKAEKVTVIVSFLAMLELVKQGAISVVQDQHFEDIAIATGAIGTPRY